MTEREPIQLFASHPSDLRVIINGNESGYYDLSPEQISVAPIRLNTGKRDWEGCHGDVDDKPSGLVDDSPVVDALVLRRVSN